jgi:hypothetical protein
MDTSGEHGHVDIRYIQLGEDGYAKALDRRYNNAHPMYLNNSRDLSVKKPQDQLAKMASL